MPDRIVPGDLLKLTSLINVEKHDICLCICTVPSAFNLYTAELLSKKVSNFISDHPIGSLVVLDVDLNLERYGLCMIVSYIEEDDQDYVIFWSSAKSKLIRFMMTTSTMESFALIDSVINRDTTEGVPFKLVLARQ